MGQAERRRTNRRTGKPRAKSNARTGVYIPTVCKYMASIGWAWTPTMAVGQGCRVHLTEGELPDGRLVVSVSGHTTAVINGVIHDTANPARDGTRWILRVLPAGAADPHAQLTPCPDCGGDVTACAGCGGPAHEGYCNLCYAFRKLWKAAVGMRRLETRHGADDAVAAFWDAMDCYFSDDDYDLLRYGALDELPADQMSYRAREIRGAS